MDPPGGDYPHKRARHSPPESVEEPDVGAAAGGGSAGGGASGGGAGKKEAAASSFRNVSACNRCRLRKNRCDQRLPSCASCEKAGVKCVGYDPITKREIPRRYVLLSLFYLALATPSTRRHIASLRKKNSQECGVDADVC